MLHKIPNQTIILSIKKIKKIFGDKIGEKSRFLLILFSYKFVYILFNNFDESFQDLIVFGVECTWAPFKIISQPQATCSLHEWKKPVLVCWLSKLRPSRNQPSCDKVTSCTVSVLCSLNFFCPRCYCQHTYSKLVCMAGTSDKNNTYSHTSF